MPKHDDDSSHATNQRGRMRGTLYGRRVGKPLTDAQRERMARLLPRLALDLSQQPPAALASLFGGPANRVSLEIGFGAGEHLADRASSHADEDFIGVEPFVNGMASLLARIEASDLNNIRVSDEDASHVLDWLPGGSIDTVFLLYPDPWPKRRHWKRRFVNTANLNRIARVLKPGGHFHVASDIDAYVNWTLRHCLSSETFEWLCRQPSDWRTPWAGWPGTRYEAKALREGRQPTYLVFARR